MQELQGDPLRIPGRMCCCCRNPCEQIVEAQWRDLGMPETLWHCDVKELGPLIVSIDPDGRNLFEENKVTFNERKDKALEEIYPQVSFIK